MTPLFLVFLITFSISMYIMCVCLFSALSRRVGALQMSIIIIITRLHIGHSFITHSFLLKGEELPISTGCDELLTIEHILLTCSDLIEIRESHFTARSLRVLFQEILPEQIFNFLKEINIFGNI